MSKVEILYNDVMKYNNLNLIDNIEDRLDKVLKLYIESLSSAEDRLLSKKSSTVYKELSR